jgi:methionyl-tRNA formyltransferase
MKIVLVTQDAPLYLGPFLDDLLPRLRRGGHRVAGAAVLSPTHGRSWAEEFRARLALYGPLDFARMGARVVANRVGAGAARLLPGLGCFSVDDALSRHAVPRLRPRSANDPDFVAWIAREGIDLLLSIAAPQIFRAPLLRAPRAGCLNYHMGDLPRYRGRQPLFWALLHGEREVGICVHEMEADLDSGPIVLRTSVPVEPGESLHDLYRKATRVGPALVAEAVEKLAAGSGERLPNDAGESTAFGFPTPRDGREFRRRGRRFF